MPTYKSRETGELVRIPGRKMTATDYREQARAIWRNWERGYVGGTAEETAAFAEIALAQARRLESEEAPPQ